jgi:pimeloyl-ACP methyl ester carboxylesterase
MTTYVLVGGAWLGGWCWQPVARRLRENGHDAYPVTLTGLGEREHLASSEVDLETHIMDVVNLFEFEDLHDVILLGHSYAGLVVTGAADRVPGRISRLVYLDTGPIPSGTALIEMFPPEARKHIEEQVEELGEGWRFPLPPPEELATMGSLEGLDEEDLALLRSRAVPQPFGTYTQPLRLENPSREELSRIGILCSISLDQVQEAIASGDPLFRELSGPNWQFIELPTGHWPMFSRPDDLADLLHRARRLAKPGAVLEQAEALWASACSRTACWYRLTGARRGPDNGRAGPRNPRRCP